MHMKHAWYGKIVCLKYYKQSGNASPFYEREGRFLCFNNGKGRMFDAFYTEGPIVPRLMSGEVGCLTFYGQKGRFFMVF